MIFAFVYSFFTAIVTAVPISWTLEERE